MSRVLHRSVPQSRLPVFRRGDYGATVRRSRVLVPCASLLKQGHLFRRPHSMTSMITGRSLRITEQFLTEASGVGYAPADIACANQGGPSLRSRGWRRGRLCSEQDDPEGAALPL